MKKNKKKNETVKSDTQEKKSLVLTGDVETDVFNLEEILYEDDLLEICEWCRNHHNGVATGGRGTGAPAICRECLDKMFPD